MICIATKTIIIKNQHIIITFCGQILEEAEKNPYLEVMFDDKRKWSSNITGKTKCRGIKQRQENWKKDVKKIAKKGLERPTLEYMRLQHRTLILRRMLLLSKEFTDQRHDRTASVSEELDWDMLKTKRINT